MSYHGDHGKGVLFINDMDTSELWLQYCIGISRKTGKDENQNPSASKIAVQERYSQPPWAHSSRAEKFHGIEPISSRITKEFALKTTLTSSHSFLQSSSSCLMSTAGQNRIFHHVFLPIRTSSKSLPESAASDLPRAFPEALTVLAMASRQRRLQLAPSIRRTGPSRPLVAASTSSSRVDTPWRSTTMRTEGRPPTSPRVPFLGWE